MYLFISFVIVMVMVRAFFVSKQQCMCACISLDRSNAYQRSRYTAATVHVFLHNRVVLRKLPIQSGSEIAPSWLPMRLNIESWRPEFYNWSPADD